MLSINKPLKSTGRKKNLLDIDNKHRVVILL